MTNYFNHKMRGKSPATIAAMIIFGIIFFTGLAILFGFVIMWLWNWLVPELFGLPIITYWQGIGLFILMKILFGSMGSHSKSKHHNSHKCKSEKQKKKKDFSKWEHYDKFWDEVGDQAYEDYVNNLNGDNREDESVSKSDDSNGNNEIESKSEGTE